MVKCSIQRPSVRHILYDGRSAILHHLELYGDCVQFGVVALWLLQVDGHIFGGLYNGFEFDSGEKSVVNEKYENYDRH